MSDTGGVDAPEPPPAPDRSHGSVTVLGTAHVSHASVEEVREAVARESPDVVAVELDEGRYRQMQGGQPDDIQPEDLLSGNTVFQFLAYWMLSYVQSQLGDRFDIEPGADMRAAIEAAEEHGAGVALVDRDIQVTIQRFWARLTFSEKLQMVGGLALGVADPRTIGVGLGAGIGLFVGLVFAALVAPAVGLGDALLLGITDATTLQYVGAGAGGALLGALLGLLFFPSMTGVADRTGGRVSALSVRIVAGVAIGAGVCLALVATETFVGPFSTGAFENTGVYAIRGTIGILAGIGLGALVGGLFGLVLDALSEDVEGDLEEFDIEELTDGDVVAAMMEEFRRFSPRGAEALIDERDIYIAHHLQTLAEQGYDVLAVVGAGHKAGIEGYLADPESIPPVESISQTTSSRRFSLAKAFGYLVMAGFFGFFFLLIMAGVQNTFLLQLFVAWFLVNGVFAFTFARLSGARWASATVGGCVAWLTSINPLLAPGWFAGYVELRKRPVNVSDIGTLNELIDDTERPIESVFRDMIDVPLFRLILIVAMTNIGSIIATFLFVLVVLPWMAPEIGGVDAMMNELFTGAQNSLDLLRGLLS